MEDNILRAYYVWPQFPSISITGTACLLKCIHCDRVYLKHMNQANTPEKLVQMCQAFKEKGAKGVLLSGGCNEQGGLLHLDKMLPAIREVHEMGFIIKLHTGFCDEEMAKKIADTGVDIASQEIVGDSETVKDIFALDVDLSTYYDTFLFLAEAGVPYLCPHLCVGLHYGKLKGELNALELMKESFKPSTLAIIAFRPTKGTPLEDCHAPTGEDMAKVVARARELFPETKLILGAMRPRSSTRNDPNKQVRIELERAALDNGINGIEIPSNEIVRTALERGFSIKNIQAYGVLPVEYEDRVETEWK